MPIKLNKSLFLLTATLTIVTGILVIIGWYTHNDFLRSVFADQLKMKFNSALAFIFSAAVLLIKYHKRRNKVWSIIASSLSILVILIGSLTLIEYLTGSNFRIDELFMTDEFRTTADYFAGRMSPIAASGFTLIGIGLLFFNNEKSRYYQFFSLSLITFVSILMLVGFNFVSDIPAFIRMSFLTALGFIILAAAKYFAQPILRKKISFEFKLFTGISSVIIMIMLLGILSSYYNDKRGNASDLIDHTNKILIEAEYVMNIADLLENENELYVSTGDNEHIKHLNTAEIEIFRHTGNIDELTHEDISQQVIIDKLNEIIHRQISFTQQCIQTKMDLGNVAATKLINSRIGESNTKSIRDVTDDIESEALKSLSETQREKETNITSFNRIFFVFLVSVFLLLMFILFSIRRYIFFRNHTESESREIQIALKKTQSEIILLNNGLEKTIASRTQELLKSEKKYRYLFENNPMPMWIVDYYYNFLDVNLSAIESYGYSREEFLSMTSIDIRADSDKENISKIYNKFVYKNHSAGIYRHVKKDGTVISVEIKVDNIVFNDVSARLVLANDVTERLITEERMKLNEATLNAAQAIAHLGSWEINFASGDGLWSNECCRIYGLPVEDNMHTFESWKSFIHPDDVGNVMKTVSKGEASKNISSFSHRIIRKDGNIRFLLQDPRYKQNKVGELTGIYGITHDITERHIAEVEKEKLTADILRRNKELEQFAYIISHNLRAPVANIIGFADELRIEGNTDEENSMYISELSASVNKLDEVIIDLNDILNSKQEINEAKEVISLTELVVAIRTSIMNLISKEDVEIITDFKELEIISSVRSYIHSIFQNLITNSIKYKQPGKRPVIEISSMKKNGKIILTFKDNGSGIDLNRNAKNVFGLYKRFHKGIEGKGMGLYMVKSQIESLGGTIKIESAPNEGTTFVIELPYTEVEFSKVI